MIPVIKLHHCNRLITDISTINETDAEEMMPYILRSAIILFSAEMEDNIKKIVTIALKHYPFVVKQITIGEIREFLKNFGNKSRNPTFSDIKKLLKIFDIDIDSSISDNDKEFYSNFINKRNKIAHDPRAPISFSFGDFTEAVNIGEAILNNINKSLFLKVTEHIKNEFT
ncbi:HEPN domain-containing protein [Hydrogenimonas sp.]